jgi:hypothetical protein
MKEMRKMKLKKNWKGNHPGFFVRMTEERMRAAAEALAARPVVRKFELEKQKEFAKLGLHSTICPVTGRCELSFGFATGKHHAISRLVRNNETKTNKKTLTKWKH